ncbi:MAG: DMT family transporter [Ascidiaceihabitans sp.]|nr:DMT family transporter [Ascidiaceihabitans sp.]
MNPVPKAAIWMTGAIASFSTMAVAGREVSFALDTFEIMLFRSVVGVIIVAFAAIAFGTWRQINGQQFSLHFARNVMHFIGQNLWFYAVTVIPLAQVFALEFTSPIWVILLSPLLLGERITLIRAAAALMGFIGVLVVTRPDMAGINTGVIMAASLAIFFAFTIIFTKRLTRTQSITCILFYLTVLQLGFGLITAGYDGDIALPNAETLPWLVLIGVAGLLGHFCITNALAIAPATVVVPIDFIRLPIIAIIGMLAYGEALDLWVLLGAGIIFAGNYLNIWSETRVPTTLK